MVRPIHHPIHAKRALPFVIVVIFVLALLPLDWIRWVGWFGGLAQTIIAPVSAPASRAAGFLRTGGGRAAPPEVVQRLEQEKDHFRLLYEQQKAEILRLQRLLDDLRADVLRTDTPTRQLIRPVIGRSSDLTSSVVTVRAGARDGALPQMPVAIQAVQLYGRVETVRERHCLVRPITDRDAGGIDAIVMFDTGHTLRCRLSPVGDGSLRGRVEEETAETGPLQPGLLVRLADDSWPTYVQRFEIGRVESIEPNPDQPLRQIITVRPRLDDLARASEVSLVIPIEDEGGRR